MTDASSESDRVAQITWLYLVVNGRPPDPGGLVAYTGRLRRGDTLRQLADEFVEAEEFKRCAGLGDPANTLYRNAFGTDPDSAPPNYANLGALAFSLVSNPTVQDRLLILPALFPSGAALDDPDQYRAWLLHKPVPNPVTAEAFPSISFVIRLDRPNPTRLAAAITTILAQPFPEIEILLVTKGLFPKVVRRQAAENPRLHLLRAKFWQGPADCFNHALEHCRGTFTTVIGQHDRLSATAVAELATSAVTADVILSDDDAIDANGLRHSPRLGTAWDWDRALVSGCPGLMLARTALLRQVGGMQPADGQEEWDMLLRISAIAGTRIAHVPSILLSRRDPVRPGGITSRHGTAARRHLAALGQSGCTVQVSNNVLRVIYPLPKTPPLASIIIPTRDRADLLRTCVTGLFNRTAYPDVEVVLLDNGSTEPEAVALLNELAQDRRVRILAQPGPFNWSALNNAGVEHMRGEVAILLNNDTEVIEPDWLREMVSHAIRPEVGIVGAKLLYADRSVQHAGVVLGPAGRATHMWRHAPGDAPGYLNQLITTRQVTVVTGACLAIRRTVYDAIGGCDASNLAVTWNDSDLCLRARAHGLRVLWTPHARLLHLEQATRGTDDTPDNQDRFARERAWMRARWNGAIDADPFHNPNIIPDEAQPQPHLRVAW
ncbi:MAG: glycosyltransferase [Oxalobacteraceae bacterium]|nr:MAG: glycosyltransferase [Oxalobacteraceae bacterium]